MYLKIALYLFLTTIINPSAHAWDKIVDCNNGEFVLDVSPGRGYPYQVVARAGLAADFLAKGALEIQDLNTNGEFVFPAGVHSHTNSTSRFSSWISYPKRMLEIQIDWRNKYAEFSIVRVYRNGHVRLAEAQYKNCYVK